MLRVSYHCMRPYDNRYLRLCRYKREWFHGINDLHKQKATWMKARLVSITSVLALNEYCCDICLCFTGWLFVWDTSLLHSVQQSEPIRRDVDVGDSAAGYISVHVVRKHHRCNHPSTGKMGYECSSGTTRRANQHPVDIAEGAGGTPPEALHTRSGHVRCSHVAVPRMLAAGLDCHIADSIQTVRNKLDCSQYDSLVCLSSLLHESGCVFYRWRPLSFRISASRLQDGNNIWWYHLDITTAYWSLVINLFSQNSLGIYRSCSILQLSK